MTYPPQLTADRKRAEQRGQALTEQILADQAMHAQFWRDLAAGRIVLTVPGYEGTR